MSQILRAGTDSDTDARPDTDSDSDSEEMNNGQAFMVRAVSLQGKEGGPVSHASDVHLPRSIVPVAVTVLWSRLAPGLLVTVEPLAVMPHEGGGV